MVLVVVAIIQFPITMLNKIEKLRIFSFLGVSGITVFILTFLVYYFVEISKGVTIRKMEIMPDDWNKAIATIPNIIFSLTFQSNFFPIFKGLESSNDRRMIKVVIIGAYLCISAYLLLGFLGFSITSSKAISPNFLQEISF
jgi:amino acid permease